ncbi:putative 4-hydroxybenzoate polyprenyltransferase [Candidatus Sulfobium mesophilum]|uniref:4-hydroxybenzoate polyprenyltransferase n=1 Tax=Candidatus Sulfobium mesophilum TaxID=2016548 RepID=A0A2U3QGF2_9BACT|nr:putative 4-hydroxybenzoate polyprenyltransferase [Candidatus Sulfobium mesophilum]
MFLPHIIKIIAHNRLYYYQNEKGTFMSAVIQKISLFLRMIKFSHSVFALPFAFTSALIAASGLPSLSQIFWIIVAMVGARSGAMGLNRIIDRRIDAANPRTAGRELPRGAIGVPETVLFVLCSFSLMVWAAYMLNPLCLKLSPVAIGVLFVYSFTKRFTWASHFVLGLAISAAPLGAWIAVKGAFDAAIIPLAAAVIFWLAGFDVLYALQDIDFDRSHGLYSIPRRFGVKKSLYLSRSLHAGSFLLLLANGLIFQLGAFYWAGMMVIAGLFIYEHSLIRENDLSKLDMAFFNMNGYISMTVFLFTLTAYII